MTVREQLAKSPVACIVAVAATGAAVAARWVLDPWLGDSQALSLLFGAVAISVWLGGYGPALLSAGTGYIAADYLFIPPRGLLAIVDVQGGVGFATYLISCGIIIGFGEGLRRARRNLQEQADDLRTHKSRLERVERHKDQFLATLAHEIRSPLAPMLNAVSVLKRTRVGGPELQNWCSVIERQVRHISRLVEDLLDVSRIGSGRLQLSFEMVDLRVILDGAIEMARPQVEARAQDLQVSIASGPTALKGDPTRLTQVFVNLLANAARYTPCGGHISLTLQCNGELAIVSVRDDGIGMPTDLLPRIFDIYMQIDRHEERAQGGLGIGLWLVRNILDLHGASIEARSEGVGRGSEFIVRLPVVDAVGAGVAADPYASHIGVTPIRRRVAR